jgi:transcriptional regulator with XRE-family HTH domain
VNDEKMSVGQRIAYYRKQRGMHQVHLAGQVGRSVPWLSRIERGQRTVEKVADLLALARVLKVEPGDLIGGISLPANGGGPLDPPRGIIAVRGAVVAVRAPDQEPPTAAELGAAVKRVNQLEWNGSYQHAALLLPQTLAAARAGVAAEVLGAWGWLSGAYRIASRLARNLGERDLVALAADRAITAAQHAGDGLAVAASTRHLAFGLLSLGLVDEAGGVCSDGADSLAPTNATSVEGWSLWGSLQLTGAVAAAREQDHVGGRGMLREAKAAAERVGPGRNDYWECFGPANVGAHEVAVELELGDVTEALRIADGVEVDELPVNSRRVRFLVDVASAHELRRDDAATVSVLLEAERYSPEGLRHQVAARELVRVCLKRERKSRTPGLRGLAERLRVTAD